MCLCSSAIPSSFFFFTDVKSGCLNFIFMKTQVWTWSSFIVQLQWKDLAHSWEKLKSPPGSSQKRINPIFTLISTTGQTSYSVSQTCHHVPHFLDISTSDLYSCLSELQSARNYHRTPGDTVHWYYPMLTLKVISKLSLKRTLSK